MWWKLGVVLIAMAGLIFCLIPIRIHAVLIDAVAPPATIRWTLSFMISNMYFTPGSFMPIGIVLAAASYVGFRIVHSE